MQPNLRQFAEGLLANPSFDIDKIYDTKEMHLMQICGNLDKVISLYPDLIQSLRHVSTNLLNGWDDGVVGKRIFTLKLYCQNDEEALALIDDKYTFQYTRFYEDGENYRLLPQWIRQGIKKTSKTEWLWGTGTDALALLASQNKNPLDDDAFQVLLKIYLKRFPGTREITVEGSTHQDVRNYDS